jgi:hypothetical protein
MSTWRRLAMEQFPELANTTLPLDTLVDLVCELKDIMVKALDAEDRERCQRVIAYALWAAAQTKNEPFVHFMYDLFRDAIASDRRRHALWRQLDAAQFAALKTYFVDHMHGARITAKEIEREYRDAR